MRQPESQAVAEWCPPNQINCDYPQKTLDFRLIDIASDKGWERSLDSWLRFHAGPPAPPSKVCIALPHLHVVFTGTRVYGK